MTRPYLKPRKVKPRKSDRLEKLEKAQPALEALAEKLGTKPTQASFVDFMAAVLVAAGVAAAAWLLPACTKGLTTKEKQKKVGAVLSSAPNHQLAAFLKAVFAADDKGPALSSFGKPKAVLSMLPASGRLASQPGLRMTCEALRREGMKASMAEAAKSASRALEKEVVAQEFFAGEGHSTIHRPEQAYEDSSEDEDDDNDGDFIEDENEIMAMLDKHDEERARQSKSETSDDADFTSTDSDHALGSDTMSVGESKGYSNQEGEEEDRSLAHAVEQSRTALLQDSSCSNSATTVLVAADNHESSPSQSEKSDTSMCDFPPSIVDAPSPIEVEHPTMEVVGTQTGPVDVPPITATRVHTPPMTPFPAATVRLPLAPSTLPQPILPPSPPAPPSVTCETLGAMFSPPLSNTAALSLVESILFQGGVMSSATKAVRMLRAGQTDAELMKRILKGLQSKPGRTETAKRFGGGVKFVGPSFCTPKYKTGNGMTRLVQGLTKRHEAGTRFVVCASSPSSVEDALMLAGTVTISDNAADPSCDVAPVIDGDLTTIDEWVAVHGNASAGQRLWAWVF